MYDIEYNVGFPSPTEPSVVKLPSIIYVKNIESSPILRKLCIGVYNNILGDSCFWIFPSEPSGVPDRKYAKMTAKFFTVYIDKPLLRE